MQNVIALKDRFDIAFACETDHDRHGIVTSSTGLAFGGEGNAGASTQVSATRPAMDYTARLTPHCPGVAVPLEPARVLWQR
jgi:phosphoglucomutase